MPENETEDESEKEDNVQMNFLASQSQRERWEEYADEVGFRNLSGLFRFAIEKEVKGNGDAGDDVGVPENLTEQLSEVVEGLNRVESRMHDLDTRMASIESEVREDADIKQLASEVFGILPTKKDIIEFEKSQYPDDSPATAGTLDGIATELDEEQYRVTEALDQLQQDTHQVHTMTLAEEVQGWDEFREGGDETRYYKEA